MWEGLTRGIAERDECQVLHEGITHMMAIAFHLQSLTVAA